jgi:C4-dicarboxylate transporter
MLKIIIVVLFIGVVISLASGLAFLFKDTDRPESRRTLHALGVRVTLAAALLASIAFGFYTGELRIGSHAPWHTKARAPVDVAD